MSKSHSTVSRTALHQKGCFTGIFTNEGLPDIQQITQFRDRSGGNFPLVMWYHAFAIGFDFRVDACRQVLQFGGTPFLRLEPWSWGGPDDDSFPLEAINAGMFDSRIRRFAGQSRAIEAPILMSFGHEMNVPFEKRWYPWGGNPLSYVAAFRRIVGLFREEGARHVEWVFA